METDHVITRYRIVSSEAEKNAALREAHRDGLQWVSSSRVLSGQTWPSEFVPGVFRMKFQRKAKRNV